MKKFLITIILLSTSFAFAENLSITEYINLLKTNDPEYLNLKAAKKQIEGNLISATAIYDWQLTGQTSKTYKNELNEGGNKLDNFNQFAYQTSVSKIFSDYATMFSATYGYGNSQMTPPAAGTEIKNYKPYLEMNLTQPLLKNSNGKIYSYSKDFLEINKTIIEIQYKEMEEAYFAEKTNLYLTWVLDTRALQITNQHFKNMMSLHQQIERQYKLDYINESDLLKSREGIDITEDMLKSLLNEWNNIGEKISKIIGIPFKKAESPDLLTIYPEEFNINNGIKEDILRNILIYDEQIKSVKLDLKLAEENSKLQLDAFANYTVYDSDTKETGFIGDMNKSDYTIGAQFSIDLEQNDTIGSTKESEEKLKEIEKNKTVFIRDRNTLLSQFKNSITQTEYSIEKYKKIVTMSEKRLMLETQRYNLGKIPYKFLIDTQNEVLNYKQKLLGYEINRQQLFVNYMVNNDTFLEYITSL